MKEEVIENDVEVIDDTNDPTTVEAYEETTGDFNDEEEVLNDEESTKNIFKEYTTQEPDEKKLLEFLHYRKHQSKPHST